MPLQSQQIISLATQIAKVPGYTQGAGQLLNMILSELCETYDFEVTRQTFQFTFTGANGPYNLPANYLRSLPNDIFYLVQIGLPYFLVWAEKPEYDRFLQIPTLAGFPTRYWTDMSFQVVSPGVAGGGPGIAPNPNGVPQLWVWPPPSGAYPVTVSYYSQMPDITTPEASTAIPWFPCQSYLLARLAGELMKIADDQRAGQFLGDSDGSDGQIEGCQSVLRKYLMMKDDADNTVKTVKLDRRLFSGYGARLPESKAMDWAATAAGGALPP